MPLQSSGQISFSQIACELTCTTPYSNLSLRNMSSAAGKTTPDSISEFYGYSNFISNVLIVGGGGGGSGVYSATNSAGGGGGGVCELNNFISKGTSYSVVIGAGGVGGQNSATGVCRRGCPGSSSCFSTTVAGGGCGGGCLGTGGASGTPQSNAGGGSLNRFNAGGGGGGAGGVGGTAPDANTGGDAGAPYSRVIDDVECIYGSGGAGSGFSQNGFYYGGHYGRGGDGTCVFNTSNGSSGIVVVRYCSTAYCFTGGNSCCICNGWAQHNFTTSGNLTAL